MKRSVCRHLGIMGAAVALAMWLPLSSVQASKSQNANHTPHKKSHKQASRVIVLNNDDLPKNGHYAMVQPEPMKNPVVPVATAVPASPKPPAIPAAPATQPIPGASASAPSTPSVQTR